MDTPDIIAVVASLFSIAVAVLAIWLAIVFYRMSSQFSESAREADRRITTSVERLEKLFDSLYSDTFSLMRDTVSDMRKHIWPTEQTDSYDIEAEIEKKTESKMKELRERLDLELSELLQGQAQKAQTDSHLVSSLPSDIQQIMSEALSESSVVVVEAREEVIRELILSVLKAKEGGLMPADELLAGIPFPHFYTEIEKMRDEGILLYDDSDYGTLQPHTIIRKA